MLKGKKASFSVFLLFFVDRRLKRVEKKCFLKYLYRCRQGFSATLKKKLWFWSTGTACVVHPGFYGLVIKCPSEDWRPVLIGLISSLALLSSQMGKTLASIHQWQCWLWERLVPLIGPSYTLLHVLQAWSVSFSISLPTPTHSCYPHMMTDLFFPTPPKYPCLFTDPCVRRSYIFIVWLFRITGDKVQVIMPEQETASLAKLIREKVASRVASREGQHMIAFEKTLLQ